jgi:hypothetical protein
VLSQYRIQTEDLVDGGVLPSSGGTWVYGIPGLSFGVLPNTSLRISGHVPLYRKLNGTQLSTSYKITAALVFSLPL